MQICTLYLQNHAGQLEFTLLQSWGLIFWCFTFHVKNRWLWVWKVYDSGYAKLITSTIEIDLDWKIEDVYKFSPKLTNKLN